MVSMRAKKKQDSPAEAIRRRARQGAPKEARLLSAAGVLLRLLLPVLLGCGACYYLVTADFLTVRTIRVSGCSIIDCEKIAERAGIVPGRNIFFADVGRTMRMLEEDPWIERAVVKRILPDTIEIQVQERTAVAALELDTDCLVDAAGAVFSCSDRHDGDLPVIAGLSREYVLANGEAAAALLDEALRLIGGLRRHGMVRPGGAMRIVMDAGVGLSFEDNGTRIFVGHDRFEEKLKLLAFIQGDLALKGLTALNINLGSERQASVSLSVPEAERPLAKGSKKAG